jgi:hypothetical protein
VVKKPAELNRRAILPWLDVLMTQPRVSHPRHLTGQQAAFRDDYLPKIPHDHIVGYGFIPGRNPLIEGIDDGAIIFYTDSDDQTEIVRKRTPEKIAIPTLKGAKEAEHYIRTAVYCVGNLAMSAAFSSRSRPVQPGYSVSHIDMPSGSVGAAVSPGDDPEHPYILSCHHVLVRYLTFNQHDRIIQPGRSDSGGETDVIAALHDRIELNPSDDEFNNISDAAIARMIDPNQISHIYPNVGEVRTISDRILRNMRVKKIGRTTGQTFGVVADPFARIRVRLPQSANSTVQVGFRDVVFCTSFTQRGDSGAAVLSDSNALLGLVIAGTHKVTVFCRIVPIFEALKLRLWRRHT